MPKLTPRINFRRRLYTTAVTTSFLSALPLAEMSPEAAIWTTPAILLASILIAWGAESAQFFIAQGFALAILAWLQTLPEFAVEAVLAWKQQVPLLLANLTGALRLLTGLGWPMIYATAAFFHRRKYKRPMGAIMLDQQHALEVVGLAAPLAYMSIVYLKGNLTLWDGAVLVLIYVAYLFALSKMPPQDHEGMEQLEGVPRFVVSRAPWLRNSLIALLFITGGALIYFLAEPFLGSLLAVSAALGIPSFVFVQWVAPFVSEFPEKVSAFYWARTIQGAPLALMNMVSSNINQWTLLTAMLVIVFSLSRGTPSTITFDPQQKLELSMTLGQSVVGMMFLLNMQLRAWEATLLFFLWAIQFSLSAFVNMPGDMGFVATHIHEYTNYAYWLWAAIELVRVFLGLRQRSAITLFRQLWREHLAPPSPRV